MVPRYANLVSVMATSDGYLDTVDLAERIGVNRDTIRVYLARATRHRRAGEPQPGDLPEPDRYFGRSPAWLRSTIDRWVEERPGHGWRAARHS